MQLNQSTIEEKLEKPEQKGAQSHEKGFLNELYCTTGGQGWKTNHGWFANEVISSLKNENSLSNP